MESPINDSEIKNFFKLSVEDVNKDIELRTGRQSDIKLSDEQLDRMVKEFKSLEYFPKLTKEDLKFDEEEKKLVAIGYYLIGGLCSL